ncbi:MAG TPA: TRAP transporter small permease [Caulobacterales bacterium]|nr:TRAP transporter small permease [Caulobacterales bacterium]
MSDETAQAPKKASGPLAKACFVVGGVSLLAAMAIDFVSVAGRHLGFPIVGALELVQYCIAGIVSTAVVVATLTDNHAAVHVITERLGAAARRVLSRFSDVMSVLFFLAVLAGDAWIAWELWPRDERSDLLGLPFAPMRMLWCAGLVTASAIALAAALGLRAGRKSDDA